MQNILLTIFFFTLVCSSFAQTPPTPTGLKAEYDQDQNEILLSWDTNSEDDTLTYGYVVFNNFPPSEKLYLNGKIDVLKTNKYRYEINYPYGATYRFSIAAKSDFVHNTMSPQCEIVEIEVPSIQIPMISQPRGYREGSSTFINWRYNSKISDLMGFRIYHKGQLLQNEQDLNRDARETRMEGDENIDVVEISAVTKSGIESTKVRLNIK